MGTAYYWIQKTCFCIILIKAGLGLLFHTTFSAGVAAVLFFRKKMKFIDPDLIAQLLDWTALLCTGVAGIVPSTSAGIDFTSHLPLFTDCLL